MANILTFQQYLQDFKYSSDLYCNHHFIPTFTPVVNTTKSNRNKRKVIDAEYTLTKRKRPEPEDLSKALILYNPIPENILISDHDYTMMEVESF